MSERGGYTREPPEPATAHDAKRVLLHVTPIDLRTLSQGGLLVRFAMLGSMAYVLAETPATGSAGTSLERPCTDPHWGFVIEGELIVVRGGRRETIGAGRAFHVPAGDPPHHFETTARSLIAGFAPVDPALDLSDSTLAAQGFNVVADRSPADRRAGGHSGRGPAAARSRANRGRCRATS